MTLEHSILVSLGMVALGCGGGGTGPDIVEGPYTGPTHRYVVDQIRVPQGSVEAREVGADLDDDGTVDNSVGSLTSSLMSVGNLNLSAADLIASGALASTVEIVADDLGTDESVGILYRGTAGSDATFVGGSLVDGVFRSNRALDLREPATASIVLPVFIDADATPLDARDLEMELTADGAGGFDGIVRGTVDQMGALLRAYPAVDQMLAASPQDHKAFMYVMEDEPQDYVLEQVEFVRNATEGGFLAPDAEMRGVDRVAFAFRVHLKPCADGNCALAPPADTCHDRILDGDETDIDCGGSCRSCAGGERCELPGDCQSGQCASQVCAAVSCDDGLQNGYETGVDIGGPCMP